MITPQIQALCLKVWPWVNAAKGPLPGSLCRELYAAILADMLAVPSYDPEDDRRVEWLRCTLKGWQASRRRFDIDPALHAIVAMLLAKDPESQWQELEDEYTLKSDQQVTAAEARGDAP